ncbi:MAG: hypothetical protein HRF52_00130 [Ignavibacterium sp.]|jgi:hypothetical protein|uniref:hypothetical protein n=1 Tax=Ignavibacterium sp. TaxID=2651167 RepID=UPI003296DE5D
MLNKIENISLNPNSRNEIKSSKKDSHLNHLTKKENFSDTITFSAALLFLSQLKWRLKKINHISTDELEVEIIANDISYSTIINLKEPSVKNLNFKVQNEFPFKHNKSLYSIDVLFNYVKVESMDEEKLYEPVNKLLYRIPSYEYSDEKEISSTFFYELLEGIETDLIISFSMIYRNMIQFSDKLAGKNNFSVIENLNTDKQLIKINKIVVNHIQ